MRDGEAIGREVPLGPAGKHKHNDNEGYSQGVARRIFLGWLFKEDLAVM